MAIVVNTQTALSTAANTKTADLVTGRNQYVGKGRLQLFAKGSATGMNITLNCGGVALMDDQAIPYTGTAGTITTDNGLVDQVVAGGRVEIFLRNTTAAPLTTDLLCTFTPM